MQRSQVNRLMFLAGVVVLASVIAWSNQAMSANTTPLKWVDAATLAGGSGNTVTLEWQDFVAAPADYYELVSTSLERPAKSKRWKFLALDVARVPAVDPSRYDVSVNLSFPGNGHFSFLLRSCRTGGECSDWVNSLDPTVAVVDGKPRGWWVYGFLDAPGVPVPIP